jgi:hypothetical protein
VTRAGYARRLRSADQAAAQQEQDPPDLMEYVDQTVAAYRDEKRENPRLP